MSHLNGAHAPNAPFTEADWSNLHAGGFKTLKLLWPDHKRADMVKAASLGVEQFIIRMPEGKPNGYEVYFTDAQAIINEFGSDIIIELGNEPNLSTAPDLAPAATRAAAHHKSDTCYQHRFFILDALGKIKQASPHTKVISPGLFSDPGSDYQWDGIDLEWLFTEPRLYESYAQCDGIGVHVYHYTDWQPILDKIWHYHILYPGKPLYVTEYGIDDPLLGQPNRDAGNAEKARRYADLLRQCANPARSYIDSLCLFILGGTPDFDHYHIGSAVSALAGVV